MALIIPQNVHRRLHSWTSTNLEPMSVFISPVALWGAMQLDYSIHEPNEGNY